MTAISSFEFRESGAEAITWTTEKRVGSNFVPRGAVSEMRTWTAS